MKFALASGAFAKCGEKFRGGRREGRRKLAREPDQRHAWRTPPERQNNLLACFLAVVGSLRCVLEENKLFFQKLYFMSFFIFQMWPNSPDMTF